MCSHISLGPTRGPNYPRRTNKARFKTILQKASGRRQTERSRRIVGAAEPEQCRRGPRPSGRNKSSRLGVGEHCEKLCILTYSGFDTISQTLGRSVGRSEYLRP